MHPKVRNKVDIRWTKPMSVLYPGWGDISRMGKVWCFSQKTLAVAVFRSVLSQPTVPIFIFPLCFQRAGCAVPPTPPSFFFLFFFFGTAVWTCFSSHRCHCRHGFDLKYQRFELISEKYEWIQICGCGRSRRNIGEVEWELRDKRKENTILGTKTILYAIETY